MGLTSSRRRPVPPRPSRHAWGRIQDVGHLDSDDEGSDNDEWFDRRVTDEISDWPRACPLLHLNIQADFPLEAQRRLVRSCYRFWLFSWWVTVMNFVATMAALLTSNVTNSGTMILSFILSIAYFFGVFFLYFRVLYWALRLESNVLFVWFYIFSLALLAFYAYIVAQALGLVAVLAQPLAPGSQLPVKVNPILPVLLFTLVVILFILCIVYVIYYFSSAFFWQRVSDKKKLKMYKKQKKKSWLASWFGGSGDSPDGDGDNDDDDGAKPKYVFPCILYYEKFEDDYLDDIEMVDEHTAQKMSPEKLKKLQKEKEKKKKKRKKGEVPHETIPIQGRLAIFPSQRKIEFKADEAIFNSVFSISVMLINLRSLDKKDKTRLRILENLYDSLPEFQRKAFHDVSATCTTNAGTVRFLEFEFETKQARDKCRTQVNKTWGIVKKKKQLFIATDEENLKQARLRLVQLNRERAEQHLLTHEDWKVLVSYVWRHTYRAGDVILKKGTHFSDILHVTSGTISIYLETSEEKQAKAEKDEDFDMQRVLFPITETSLAQPAPDLSAVVLEEKRLSIASGRPQLTRPRYYSVTFQQRKLGFSYARQKRSYNLAAFNEENIAGDNASRVNLPHKQHSEKYDDFAAIVQSIKPGSEADRLGISVGDELVKVGLFDVEQNKCSQKGITSLIRSHTYPMSLEFRRPPQAEFEVDDAGFIAPDPLLASEDVRMKIQTAEGEGSIEDPYLPDAGFIPQVVLGDELNRQQVNPASPTVSLTTTSTMTTSSSSGQYYDGRGYETESSQEEEEAVEEDQEEPVIYDMMAFPSAEEVQRKEQEKRQQRQATFQMSRLELAEKYAANQRLVVDTEDEQVEFQAAKFSSEDSNRNLQLSDLDPIVHKQMGSFDIETENVGVDGSGGQSYGAKLLAKGRRFLFGSPFDYDRVEEAEMRKQIGRTVPIDEVAGDETTIMGDDVEDKISIIVEDSDDSDSDTEEEDFFDGIPTFEAVGKFERGDTFGIIPWIINQPVSVVQLVAKNDVTLHSVQVKDITRLFRKNGTLALAFFKYVAAVIGERADRDEELLCEELSKMLTATHKPTPDMVLTRLLDSKPIKSTQRTQFSKRVKESQQAKAWFERDFDMGRDSILFSENCEAQITGDIDVLIGNSWFGPDTKESANYNRLKKGLLYVTHHYICFRTSKRTMDLAKFQKRPTLYGKVHVNDIYSVRRYGDNGETLTILTDDIRLDVTLADNRKALLVADWIQCLINSGSAVQRAPNSYTLPGDLYGFTGSKEFDSVELNDEADLLYKQQRGLRTEFLVLTQTLQQVLSKQDRVKLFANGRSVKLLKGQNVLSAARYNAKDNNPSDPFASKRPTTAKKKTEEDGPNGLYLVGEGELVVQREVNGVRVQFASYKAGTVFGVERFLTGAPSPFSVKVASKTALLKFAPRQRVMGILKRNLALAARFYQYCALLHMQRLRGPILSRPLEEEETEQIVPVKSGSQGCSIL